MTLDLNKTEAFGSDRRGFAPDVPQAVQKPAEMRFAANACLDEAFAIILQAGLQHFLANLAASQNGHDPEAVHQMRVALRRLRSALALLRKRAPSTTLEAFRNDARWLASSLNDTRDWDVFLGKTIPKIARDCPAVDGFDTLRNIATRFRATAWNKARIALTERRSQQFRHALDAWIEQRGWRISVSGPELSALAEPASRFASGILTRQHRKACKRGRHFKTLMPRERHRLRLKLKKLRDATDFFMPALEEKKTARRYARRLSHLQDFLGSYNDVVTTESLMECLRSEPMPPAAERAIGAIIGWQAREQTCLESDLRQAWRHFRKAAPPR
jgi:triphosphatase